MTSTLSRFLPAFVTLLVGCQTPGIIGQIHCCAFPPLTARGCAADEPEDAPLATPLLPDLLPPQPTPDSVLRPFPWLSLTPQGQEPHTLERGLLQSSQENQLEAGSWTAKMAMQQLNASQRWENPLLRPNWQTDEALRCTLPGPFFLFGQMGASSEEAHTTDFKVTGRTGLACKVGLGQQGEVTVRGGPGVTWTDPLRPDHVREAADWRLELQARYPLLAGVHLEYEGAAIPALTPQDRDKINQDVRLALPLGEMGKFQMGARHHWENTQDSRLLPDNVQLYLGIQLTR
jgi:hypothetical protein